MEINVEHEIGSEQVYEDDRTGDLIETVYVNASIVILQDRDGNHRLDGRENFENNVGAGRYNLRSDVPSFARTGDEEGEPIAFEEIDNIGESGAENLRAAGYETTEDIRLASDEDILDVSWIGEAGLESIKDEL